MITPRGRCIDNCQLRCVATGPSRIEVIVRMPRPITYSATVELDGRPPITSFKEALAKLEEQIGWRFESFEAVDCARQFIGLALERGYRVPGIPVLKDVAHTRVASSTEEAKKP